jgi:hypothetical protein
MQEYLNQQFPLGPGDLSLHPAGVLDDGVDLREERAAGEDRPGACRSSLRSSAGFAGATYSGGGSEGPPLGLQKGPSSDDLPVDPVLLELAPERGASDAEGFRGP